MCVCVCTHGRHVFGGELVGGVGDQQAGLPHRSVSDHDALDGLHRSACTGFITPGDTADGSGPRLGGGPPGLGKSTLLVHYMATRLADVPISPATP